MGVCLLCFSHVEPSLTGKVIAQLKKNSLLHNSTGLVATGKLNGSSLTYYINIANVVLHLNSFQEICCTSITLQYKNLGLKIILLLRQFMTIPQGFDESFLPLLSCI